jgi:uncharacterized membrane protein
MLALDWPRLHAAVNDLPAALLTAAVLFDLVAWLRNRESLAWAATWTLWLGVIGGWVAVLAGNQAEEALDHGDAIHELMERHETFALASMIAFTAILLWKLWRRFEIGRAEATALRIASLVALGLTVQTGLLGGRLVFDHAAGIPSPALETELRNRAGEHEHAPGEEHDEAAAADSTAPADSTNAHPHPPGTKPHSH